jgi:hypothetical protein
MHRLLLILDYFNILEIYFKLLVFLRVLLNLIFKTKNKNKKLIISLTTFPKRFKTLNLTLITLITQSVMPYKVVLWIYKKDYKYLPRNILNLQNKVIPAILNFPKKFILTADDDVYYPHKWSEKIFDSYNSRKKEIIGHRGHFITFNKYHKMKPYKEWKYNIKYEFSNKNIFLTGVGGILYPPNSLHKDFNKDKIYTKICDGDDIWFHFMARLKNYKFKVLNYYNFFYIWKGSRSSQISTKLVNDGLNDISLSNMVKKYKFK